MDNLLIVAADIGSVAKGNFGWYCDEYRNGTRPESLVDLISAALNSQQPVALGFECPLFVPLNGNPEKLTGARIGESTRAWSAGAGCGALATGLVQVAWILKALRCRVSGDAKAHLCWQDFQNAKHGLFIWEAFVSGNLKSLNHIGDAEHATRAFHDSLPNPVDHSCIHVEDEPYSLIGATLLRTGWSANLELLRTPCIVIAGRKQKTDTHQQVTKLNKPPKTRQPA